MCVRVVLDWPLISEGERREWKKDGRGKERARKKEQVEGLVGQGGIKGECHHANSLAHKARHGDVLNQARDARKTGVHTPKG